MTEPPSPPNTTHTTQTFCFYGLYLVTLTILGNKQKNLKLFIKLFKTAKRVDHMLTDIFAKSNHLSSIQKENSKKSGIVLRFWEPLMSGFIDAGVSCLLLHSVVATWWFG